MAALTLFCLVDGEPSSSAFPVSIATAKTIGELKKAIKTEKSPEFNDIAADKLTLWKVSISSTDDEDESPIILDELSDRKKLVRPTSEIAKVFSDGAAKEHIHIIVVRPVIEEFRKPELPERCMYNHDLHIYITCINLNSAQKTENNRFRTAG
jgi:hypothetical protein